MKYKYTEEDESLVEKFIESHSWSHMRNTRTPEELKEDIRIGKLGEIAYKIYAGDAVSDIDWTGTPQGTLGDFFTKDGESIQVKTLNEETKWCSFYNWNFDKLAVLRYTEKEITLLGEWELGEVKTFAKKSNWNGWYFDPENC